jgi:putative endopeptidase
MKPTLRCLAWSTLPVALLSLLQPNLARGESAPAPVETGFFDTTLKPGKNFYEYANGGWFKHAKIPADQAQWGAQEELEKRNELILRALAESTVKQIAQGKAKPGSIEQKVGDFYASGMDETTINAQRAKPLAPYLAAIDKIADPTSLATAVGQLHAIGLAPVFNLDGDQDEKNTVAQIAILRQGGLGLPNCEYYTKDDDASKKLREQYVQHVARMFMLLGQPKDTAANAAQIVLRVETALAKVSKTPVQLRDPEGNYHKMTLAELAGQTAGFNWDAYYKAVGVTDPGAMDVAQPEFFKGAAEALAAIPLADWKTYLTWNLLHATAPSLSNDFVSENFRFFGTTLRGTKELLPRWRRVLRAVDGGVGEALGEIYVRENFPPEAKRRMLVMIGDLKDSLREHIERLDWMGSETKKAALEKLSTLNAKIGYPDKWRDYGALEIKRQPYVSNVIAASAFDLRRRLARIGRPVDPTEWDMTPPTVNAYYNPLRNEIVFPAGILQPPFFDLKADDAGNYGSTGATIGHEMTHGFDDEGRQYDAQGNLKNWWTDEDVKRFEERGEKIVQQFNQFSIAGTHLNGKLTEGENIADLGGLKVAYAALQKRLAQLPESERNKKIGGLTPSQRFFIAYAQSWREKSRPEYLQLLIKSNPHSPPEFRVNGPLANLPDFANSFGISADSPMVQPEAERVIIW